MYTMGVAVSDIPKDKLITNFSVEDIPWAEGRFLFDLWQKKSKNGKLPARSDFNPIELKSILPNIVLMDVRQNPLNISFRLMGSFITNIIKENHTGKNLQNIPSTQEGMIRLTWLIEQKKPYFLCKIIPEWAPVDYRDYNTIALPLAVDGSNVDMIMTLTSPYEDDG